MTSLPGSCFSPFIKLTTHQTNHSGIWYPPPPGPSLLFILTTKAFPPEVAGGLWQLVELPLVLSFHLRLWLKHVAVNSFLLVITVSSLLRIRGLSENVKPRYWHVDLREATWTCHILEHGANLQHLQRQAAEIKSIVVFSLWTNICLQSQQQSWLLDGESVCFLNSENLLGIWDALIVLCHVCGEKEEKATWEKWQNLKSQINIVVLYFHCCLHVFEKRLNVNISYIVVFLCVGESSQKL